MRTLLVFLVTMVLTGVVYAGRPVGQWNVVADQRISSSFKAGVVAFHPEGLKVEFRVNGSLVHTANNPTLNDRVNVWEFWFTFDPSIYSDGAVTLDARAIALNGTDPSYDLPSLNLYANSGGSLTVSTVKWADAVNGSDSNSGTESQPYQTLAKAVQNTPAGGTIYLKAGTYSANALGGGNTRAYWTTVAAASGLGWDDVEISPGRPGTDRLKLQNLSIFTTSTSGSYTTILTGENGSNVIWLDNVKAWNKNGRYAASTNIFGNRYGAYTTGGLTTEVANGPGGSIVRDHHVQTITSDVFTGEKRLVVNCTVDDVDKGPTSAHPDFHQAYAPAPDYCENMIMYNVKATNCACQGFFGHRLINSAFVNVVFEKSTGYYNSQYSEEMTNDMWFHITLVNQTWLWRGSGTSAMTATDVSVYNSIFSTMNLYEDATANGLDIDTNHFSGTSMGTNITTGDPLYTNATNEDYTLQTSSPAYGSGKYLQCVPADINGVPYNSSGRNKGAHAAGTGGGNTPPVANAGNDQTVTDSDDNGSENVTLDGSGSSDSDGSISSYVWEENASQIATGSSPTVSFATGSHTVTLTVTDDDGATDTDTVVITVNAPSNTPPVANAGSDQSVTDSDDNGSETVTLNGSGSSDSDGSIVSYIWEENSTQIATGVTPSVTLAVGAHTITLTVTDDDGATDTDTVVVTVSAPGGGQTYVINGDTADNIARSTLTVPWAGSSSFRVGGDTSTTDACAVYVFQLPTLGTGETVTDANFDAHLIRIANNPGGAVDLYGLGYRSASTVQGTDFYQGVYDGDTTDATALQNDFAVITTPDDSIVSTDSGGDSALASYIAAQYAAGAQGGDYVFIRISPDVADQTNYYYWEFSSANSSNDPVLTITTSGGGTPNNPPVANAGSDQSLTDNDDNGSESVTLNGSASSDSDGTITSYVWEENSSQIATGATSAASFSVGIHTVTLTVTDDDGATDTDTVVITVNPHINVAPTADAGTDQTVSDSDDSGDEQITLDASGSSDSDGTIASYVWEENSTQIATGETPVVTLAVDSHTITLTVTDDDGATDTDTVSVNVHAYVNVAPTADAGTDQTVMDSNDDGSESITLNATGSSDSDGSIASYVWEENSSQIATGVSPSVNLAIGIHTITLTVTDDDGDTDTDTVVVTVDPWSATSSTAWQNFGITSQSGQFEFEFDAVPNTAGMDGITGMSSGNASWWSDVACIVRFSQAGAIDVRNGGGYSADATLNYVAGTTYHVKMVVDIPAHTYSVSVIPDGQSEIILATDYAFRTEQASVTNLDNWVINATYAGDSHTISNVVVTEIINQPPVADAGSDQTVTDDDDNGSETVTLDGSGSNDSDGTIVSYTWEENSSQIATGVGPTISLSVGIHTVTLTVTDDNGATDSDTVVITVDPYVNIAPTAVAGADQSVTDNDDNGVESIVLDATSSTDSDGTIVSYIWEENSLQIATGDIAVVSLAVGVHNIDLTVTDDDGATDSDTVIITINPYINLAPTADAGSDQTVTDTDDSGSESVTLDGSASSDSDGSIISYSWEENASQIATGVSPAVSLAVGVHTITLTVTDDDSATDTDTVNITVDAAPTGGQTYTINGDTADNVAKSNLTAPWPGSSLFRVGGDSSTTDAAAIYVFQLPTLGSGETVTDANFDVNFYRVANNPGGAVDLYGLGYRSASTVLGTDFYQGAYDGDTTDATALQNDFAVITTPGDSVVSTDADADTALASYIAAQYAAGAVGGDYVFLRLNPDVADQTNYYYWEFYSANSSNIPVLTITTGSGNLPPVADAGSDQTVTDTDGDGSESATLDGSGSADADGSITGYVWEENASQVATGSIANVTLDIGVHTIDLTVTDDDTATDTDTVDVTVVSRTLVSSTSEFDWPASTLPAQTGTFTVEFDMVPGSAGMDGVTGLSYGPGSWWSDLACIVRFNTSNQIEARDGSTYTSDTTMTYTAGVSYHVRMVVDVPNNTYSVYVTPAGSSEMTLATDYDFRTEQLGITSIDNWTLNSTNSVGTHTVSNLTITD